MIRILFLFIAITMSIMLYVPFVILRDVIKDMNKPNETADKIFIKLMTSIITIGLIFTIFISISVFITGDINIYLY